MDEEFIRMLRHLRLGGIISNWEQYVKLSKNGNYSNIRFIKYILEEEYNIKKENSRKLRIQRAHIPEEFVIETYPFSKQPKLNKKEIFITYDSFDYINKNQNIIWIGRTGCGKSGLATSFLINAINKGYSGRFVSFYELIKLLNTSIADHSEDNVIKTFLSYDCLLIDEIGYREIDAAQVGLFFTLMHKRHKKKSTLITSNLGFSEWDSFLKNKHLTAALVDRLTENSSVFNMKNCVSLRDKPNYINE